MNDSLYALFCRFMPAPLRSLLRPFVSSPQTLRWLMLYALIGALGVAAYLGLVALFARIHAPSVPAAAASFISGASVQFILNRNLNFRTFDRAVMHQAGTYVTVMTLNFALTLAIVAFCVHALRLGAIPANLLTLPVTFPIAFLANRYLTFGPGIRARIAHLRLSRAKKGERG